MNTGKVTGDFCALDATEIIQKCWLTEPTCKCEEHASRFEEVFSSFAFTGARAHQTNGTQDHKGQAEDGDGCSRDVVLWR